MSVWTLRCQRCRQETLATKETWRCPACHGPLAWAEEPPLDRGAIDAVATGLWRYAAALPIEDVSRVSLGEVTTPLVDVAIAGGTITCKLDYISPTGSFKDRGAAVLISAMRHLGAEHAIEDSSGNAAAAIAAYAARASMRCTVFAPAAASPAKLLQATLSGATVVRVEGTRDDVAHAAMRASAGDPLATYASHNWHPTFIEGVKTWAFEVWEQLGFRLPDAIVAPTGSGSLLLGAALACRALRRSGEIERIPRLYAAQPAACAPIHAAIQAGLAETPPIERRPTIAEGASIASPVRGREVLAAIRESGGGAVAVDEAHIAPALKLAARQGVYIEPTSAVAIAAAAELYRSRSIARGEQVVVVLTGSGLKAAETIQSLM